MTKQKSCQPLKSSLIIIKKLSTLPGTLFKLWLQNNGNFFLSTSEPFVSRYITIQLKSNNFFLKLKYRGVRRGRFSMSARWKSSGTATNTSNRAYVTTSTSSSCYAVLSIKACAKITTLTGWKMCSFKVELLVATLVIVNLYSQLSTFWHNPWSKRSDSF